MNSLPPEIIAEVFFLSLRDGRHRMPYEILNLTHVCGLWRDITSNTPRLWTHLNVSTSSQTNTVFHLEFVQSWARKCANFPIHLRLRQGQGPIDVEAEAEDVISLFIFIGQRLVTLELKLPLFCLANALARLPLGTFPQLRGLRISMNKRSDVLLFNPVNVTFFDPSSLLSEATVNRITIDSLSTLTVFYWHRLTKLNIDEESLELSTIRNILFQCRNLVILRIRTLSQDFNDPSALLELPIRTIPFLESLSCCLTGDEDCMSLFQPFEFPRLAYLDFTTVGNAVPALMVLRERTPFPLTRLALAHCPDITSSEMTLLFSQCNNIEELDLCDSFDTGWFNADLMEALTYEPERRSLLLPRLHKITFNIAFRRDDDTLETVNLQLRVAEMIDSRWSNTVDIHHLPRCLTQVSISFSAGENLIQCIPPLVFEIYRSCMGQGLALTLAYNPYKHSDNDLGGHSGYVYILSTRESVLLACILVPIFTYCLLQAVSVFAFIL